MDKSISKYILDQYGYLIKQDEDQRSFYYVEDIDELNCNASDKKLIKQAFRSYNIKEKMRPITKADRPKKVSEYEYGYVKANELEEIDQATVADIEYDAVADYDTFDEYIEKYIIPNFVVNKVNKSKNSKMEFDPDSETYKSIQLNKIIKLGLSEEEIDHLFEYLNEHDIHVGGMSSDFDTCLLHNYDYTRTYETINWPKPLTSDEITKMVIEYKKLGEKDEVKKEELKHTIIDGALRLIPYTIYTVLRYHPEEISNELISFGYEGLNRALELYQPDFNAKFSTYAIPCIRGYILSSISRKTALNDFYFPYNRAKKAIEDQYGKNFAGEDEMLNDIFQLLKITGDVNPSNEAEFKARLLLSNLELADNYKDILEANNPEYEDVDGVEKRVSLKETAVELLTNSRLSEKELKVIMLRFGFVDGVFYTLEEVGKMPEFNVTRERIRQFEDKALRKMRFHASCKPNMTEGIKTIFNS